LEDITLRALRVLKEAHAIFAEDTRHTRKLLAHYSISTSLHSYHQHNKRTRIPIVLSTMQSADVALVSSAGTPALSDPGFELIEAVLATGFDVDVLPGASALTTAVVGAAIAAPGFLFLGFLPRRGGDRRKVLRDSGACQYALVLYEAPHRLVSTLRDIRSELGERRVVVARELTKVHQEYVRGTVSQVLDRFDGEAPRGECTLVIAGASEEPRVDTHEARAELRRRRETGQEARRAVGDVAALLRMPRNEVYRLWLEVSPENGDSA